MALPAFSEFTMHTRSLVHVVLDSRDVDDLDAQIDILDDVFANFADTYADQETVDAAYVALREPLAAVKDQAPDVYNYLYDMNLWWHDRMSEDIVNDFLGC